MTKNEIYAEIQRTYDSDRNKADIECAERKMAVFKKIPRLFEIQREFDSNGTKLAEIFISGGDREKSLNEYRLNCQRLKNEQIMLLRENGLPEDYLEVKYKCSKCKDTGFIDNKRCECFKKKLIGYYYNMSNISKIVQKENFDNFNIKLYSDTFMKNGVSARDNIKNILIDIMEQLSVIQNTPVNMLFTGNSGMGKTYMSNCIAKYLMDREISVIYMSAYNLLNTMIKQRFTLTNKDNELIELLTECDVLIIDDLGTEGINSNTITELFSIINSRYLENKSTIISTNFTIQDIYKAYSERIVSRIMGNYKIYDFYGEDLRIV